MGSARSYGDTVIPWFNNHGDRLSSLRKSGLFVFRPLPNGPTSWLVNWGADPNHLLSGMILQNGKRG